MSIQSVCQKNDKLFCKYFINVYKYRYVNIFLLQELKDWNHYKKCLISLYYQYIIWNN